MLIIGDAYYWCSSVSPTHSSKPHPWAPLPDPPLKPGPVFVASGGVITSLTHRGHLAPEPRWNLQVQCLKPHPRKQRLTLTSRCPGTGRGRSFFLEVRIGVESIISRCSKCTMYYVSSHAANARFMFRAVQNPVRRRIPTPPSMRSFCHGYGRRLRRLLLLRRRVSAARHPPPQPLL